MSVQLTIVIESNEPLLIEVERVQAPRTIDAFLDILPFHARGIKRENKLIFNLPSKLRIPPEGRTTRFDPGDMSINPSSGNITIHLTEDVNSNRDNLLGKIQGEIAFFSELGLSSSIVIERHEE